MKIKKHIAMVSCIAAALLSFGLISCGQKNGNGGKTDAVWGDEYTMNAAYQKAAELGYTGTLEEFIAAISGKDGEDGKDGIDGVDGIDGLDGVGIHSIVLNADGEIVITDTTGKVIFKQKLPLCTHVYSDTVVGMAAGCTYAGYSYKVCDKCGDKDYTALPPLGHDWDDGTVVYEATCVKNGFMYYTCTVCGEVKSQVLTATGEHDFTDGECTTCGLSQVQYIDEYYNGDYGYKYLQTLSNGVGMCAFYNEIAEAVTTFHNVDIDAQSVGDDYILKKVNYAQYGLDDDQAVAVWKTYTDDKPLYYWLAHTTSFNGNELSLYVVDEYADGGVRMAYNTELYGYVKSYEQIAQGENDYTVALAYHDKIIEAIDYAYKANNQPETAAWAHNITGVLEGTGAVCEGYARTFQLLLNARGINNVFVSGKGGTTDHAWNLVEIDGQWYWYDLTYDDTPDYIWGISHDYFCATDDNFIKNHTPDNGVGVHFLYDLPERAQNDYSGDDALFFDGFTADGGEYVVVGYDTLDLCRISATDSFDIPAVIEYRGRDYSVVSIMDCDNGKLTNGDVVDNHKYTKVRVSSTVKYIHDGALRSAGLITVDEANPLFTGRDGALFTKNLYTLITYPLDLQQTEYVIPDETAIIAYHAFTWNYTKNLEKLTIGKNVRSAGLANWGAGYRDDDEMRGGNFILGEWLYVRKALNGAKQLLVDEDNAYFTIKDGLLLNKAETHLYTVAQHDLATIVIPETVVAIESNAFDYCDSLVSITFHDGIRDVDEVGFTECRKLEHVVLPNDVQKITRGMFFNCFSLKSLTIPDSVKIIERSAFVDCYKLEGLILPDGLTRIEKGAFYECWALAYLVIPDSVEYIGEEFIQTRYFDTVNTDIYYKGAADEWAQVTKDYDFTNPEFAGTIYFYSEEQPTAEGDYWHYVDGAPVAW